MRFKTADKEIDDLKVLEEFENKYKLASHYANHVMRDSRRADFNDDRSRFTFMTPEQYESNAEDLMNRQAGPSDSTTHNIVGFVDRNGNYVKYWKAGRQFLVYNPETGKTITFFKTDLRGYLSKKDRDFASEIPEAQNNGEAENE